jgi:acyl carrier protein
MITTMGVEDRLYRTIAGVLDANIEDLSEESSPDVIASWDSLNHLNLIMAIEEEFQVRFTPEDALAMNNISAIRAILSQTGTRHEADICFADFRQDQLPQLKAFLAKAYGEEYVLSANDAYFRWQYAAPTVAQGEHINLRLAIVEGQIAGCLGYIPIDVAVMGRTLRGAWLANWMVDPDRRDLGIGPLLVRDVAAEFDITLALGASHDAHHILSRMGWTDFGMLHRHICILDREKAAMLTGTGQLEWPTVLRSVGEQLAPGSTIAVVDRFDQSVTKLWERTWGRQEMAAGTCRSAKFLNWRYAEHPQFDYHLFEARTLGECTGIAVYRLEQVRNMSVRIGRLMELVALPEIQGCLLDAVLDHARAAEAAAVDFFCGSTQAFGLFARRGFLPGDHPATAQIPLLFQPIDRRRIGITFLADLQNIPDANEITDWYVTKADGDQDRPN